LLEITQRATAMSDIDPVIHQPVRLRIMAALSNLGPREQVDFSFLKTKLALTDGNLGAHLGTLEEAGYIAIAKTFVARKPKTFVALTPPGRRAFEGHVAALSSILKLRNPS
jgi:DNA-binding MarR family transcriptional regulator